MCHLSCQNKQGEELFSVCIDYITKKKISIRLVSTEAGILQNDVAC